MQMYPLRIGLIGLGLEAYWSQFDGLQQRLLGYLAEVEQRIANPQRTILNLGLIDSPQRALEAGHECRRGDIDLLVVYVTTYALSSTLLPVILRSRVPILLLNLQPQAAIDYATVNNMQSRTAMTAEWLAFCSSCPVPEIANVLRRLNISFHQVTGMLHEDPSCWLQVEQWLTAAQIVSTLAHSRLGLLGHYYSGMLDIATDLVQVSGRFGIHIEHLEFDELTGLRLKVTAAQEEQKQAEFQTHFLIDADCTLAEQFRSARTSVALDQFVHAHQLDMLAYFYKGDGQPENADTAASVILGNSMLTARGIPVAGEYEVKNAIAMKILDLLGVGGSFTEFFAVDFAEDLVLMGHDGPGHPGIAQDRIRVRSLGVYHGKIGNGLSVEMAVKHGPVTLLSIVEDPSAGFKLLFAHAESVPGPVLEIGNTNSRYRFSLGARGFIEAWNAHGPAHHCAIGTGHQATTLIKIAELLHMPAIQVC